jgi:hypothetical protein
MYAVVWLSIAYGTYRMGRKPETDRLISVMRPAGCAELRRELAGPLAVAGVAEALRLHDVPRRTVLSGYAAIVAAVSEVTAGSRSPRSAQTHSASCGPP